MNETSRDIETLFKIVVNDPNVETICLLDREVFAYKVYILYPNMTWKKCSLGRAGVHRSNLPDTQVLLRNYHDEGQLISYQRMHEGEKDKQWFKEIQALLGLRNPEILSHLELNASNPQP